MWIISVEIMKITEEGEMKIQKKKNRQKTRGDRSYSERVRAK